MKINLRGRRAYLYRRRWVPAGPGVPNAHPVEDYIGVIDADAETIPSELLSVLTESEQAQLRQKILVPAAEARVAATRRERDPRWRIAEASRLLAEAARCSQAESVYRSSLNEARRALDEIRVVDNMGSRPTFSSGRPPGDKLAEALAAVKAAAAAVREGEYGKAPAEGARSTRAYKLWAELFHAVEGDGRSLLRALQDKGFVKSRKGSSHQ